MGGGGKFEGTFVDDGIKEGKLTYPNGRILEGIFVEGKIVQGTLVDPARRLKYVGSFAGENIWHGDGTYENHEIVENCLYKNVVKGQWNNGKLNGHGEWSRFKCVPDKNRRFSLISDSKYKGEYREGLRHGNGVLIYSSGTKYEGKWQDDKKHGEGTLFLGLGGTFKGTFDNDLPVCGKYTTSDGKRTIEGSCNRNFKIEGRGVLKDDVSGEVYQGEFK
ncbi:MAG: hypothetical protein QG673_871, partial [Pseudomonadota bacterium]|nr:hypothetical protein [Pseudomonadota bacterium]